MAKFRCPRCGAIFEGKPDRCPRCNVLFKFNEEDREAPEYAYPERREEPRREEPKPQPQQPVPAPEPVVEIKEVIKEVPVQVIVEKPVAIIPEKNSENTYFDGKMLQWLGWTLLGELVTLVTVGICFPIYWGWIEKWKLNHTVVNGYRLRLTRGGGRLVGRWLLWMLLSIITLFIFSLWIPKKMERWKVANMVVEFDKIEEPQKEEPKQVEEKKPEEAK